MALYVNIAGINYEVVDEGAEQLEDEVVGALRRAFNGPQRSSIRKSFRGWRFPLIPTMTTAAFNVLRDAVKDGQIVSCGGDFMGVTLNCTVKLSTAPFVYRGTTYERGVTATIVEA